MVIPAPAEQADDEGRRLALPEADPHPPATAGLGEHEAAPGIALRRGVAAALDNAVDGDAGGAASQPPDGELTAAAS